MKNLFVVIPKAPTATFLIFAFLNLILGCNYYKVTKDTKSPWSDQAKNLAPTGGDPSGIKLIRLKSDVILKLKDGSLITSKYITSDDQFAYFGANASKIDRTIPLTDIEYIKSTAGRYFILHGENITWHLKYVILSDDKSKLLCEVEPVGDDHKSYLTTKKKAGNYYEPKKTNPIKEVHIYAHGVNPDSNSKIEIPLTQIDKIELFKSDSGTELVTSLAVIVAVAAIALVIIALTKSSCPFIYTQDNDSYTFVGESYGGAIYPSLERDDYMPLPGFKPVDNQYSLKISNELLEKQHTNLAELMVVNHSQNTSVLLDQNGNILTYSDPRPPLLAESGLRNDQLEKLKSKDNLAWLFDDPDTIHNEVSDLYLSFKRPPGTTHGKLILNAKNSLWLDYVYGKFNEQFGTAYDELVRSQKKETREKLEAWSRDQDIPLTVSIDTKKGWVVVDEFHVIGPLAPRDMIMSIDLSEVPGETIRLKLHTGFMFWEINSAAMDFSENEEARVTRLQPRSAIDENGKDVRQSVVKTDSEYLSQEQVGNEVILSYADPGAGENQTLFLHSRGYYEYIRSYDTSPQWFTIMSFKKKGGFTRFAKEQYDHLPESQDGIQITSF